MRVKYLPNDVTARLDGGICFYNNHPYTMMTGGGGGNTCILRPLHGTRREQLVSLKDEGLDISSPILGYVNTKNEAIYVMRSPDRRYKQTLSPTSIIGMTISGRVLTGESLTEAIFSKNGEDMLLNKYPTLEEALKFIESGTTTKRSSLSIAFNRDVALAKDSFGITRVYFKGKEVGRIKPKTKIVIVPEGNLAWVVSQYLEHFDWEVK